MELTELALKLGEIALKQKEMEHHVLETAAKAVEQRAKAKIGEYQQEAGPFVGWAELAAFTKADRVAKGFPEDEPLLRTGKMRDSIEHQVDGNEAQVGSNSDIAVYQELGTAKIPPRSFLGGAAVEMMPRIIELIGESATAALVGKEVHNGRIEIEP